LSELEPVEMVCQVFDVPKSCFYDYRQQRKRVDVERLELKQRVNDAFVLSRSSPGSRTIKTMLNGDGIDIGRYKVGKLMGEMGLVCEQQGPHAYKQATIEHPNVPNLLDRQFDVEKPDAVWCGDITYI
jgi:putative transposase